jgi:hypothetical protein
VRTEELIVQLAHGVAPVRPLPPPAVRLVRWFVFVLLFAALGVLLLQPRADVTTALRAPIYVTRELTTLATAGLAAACALVLSVPGAEPSSRRRMWPLVGGVSWVVVLTVVLIQGGDAASRLGAFPVNPRCIYQIVGLSIVPGVTLFAMLRRAAPLHLMSTAALASLAAITFGAAATQLLCPVDDPAHQLVGHVLPVALLTVLGAILGRLPLKTIV